VALPRRKRGDVHLIKPTYIANNAAVIVNYSRRWDNGERISTAFVESTVNLVISRRFAKKQPMQWSKAGAHRLLLWLCHKQTKFGR
jgi:hypothetical protein